jgi:hypothetical protein
LPILFPRVTNIPRIVQLGQPHRPWRIVFDFAVPRPPHRQARLQSTAGE